MEAFREEDGLLPPRLHDRGGVIRLIRKMQGLGQAEVAKRMGLNPSVPALWENGKRSVPSRRVEKLAEVLGVPLEELVKLFEGQDIDNAETGQAVQAAIAVRLGVNGYSGLVETLPIKPFEQAGGSNGEESGESAGEPQPEEKFPAAPEWVLAERPVLKGFIPEGWEPSDRRVRDINPSLLDGYWLDPVKMEKPRARRLLRDRLCQVDQEIVGDKEVPGIAMVERIFRHCSKGEGFTGNKKTPLAELIVRRVLGAEYGGGLPDSLADSIKAVEKPNVDIGLIRKLGTTVAKHYPFVSWVDRGMFS